MKSTHLVAGVVVSMAVAGAVVAQEEVAPVTAVVERRAQSSVAEVDATMRPVDWGTMPVVSQKVPRRVREKLEVGFAIAAQRIEEVEGCAGLFEELGTTGREMLSTTIYYPSDPRNEGTTCRRGSAYTWVGAAPTRLCRRFETLSDSEAAMVVVHEALHHAGLSERPVDPHGMSSRGINKMVRNACGF